jgi:hypothetical protein
VKASRLGLGDKAVDVECCAVAACHRCLVGAVGDVADAGTDVVERGG